jgi:signal transduction protein with GAF and PtsI domain
VREFTGAILNPYDLQDLLDRLTHHATQVLSAGGAGIMLADEDGELEFVAASQERIVEVERLQARLRQGVCHEAFSANEVVHLADAAADPRWPEYTRLVVESGFRSVLGIPLNAVGQTIGVINIYRVPPGTWSSADVGAAEIIAAMGAGYLLNANQMRAQTTLAEQLRSAIDAREVIGQAKGILMARNGIDGDQAFELLRRMSQGSDRKLREVAEDVIERQGEGA